MSNSATAGIYGKAELYRSFRFKKLIIHFSCMSWTLDLLAQIATDWSCVLVLTIAGASLVAMETIVVAVTCSKLWATFRQSTEMLGSRTLSGIVLEGGWRFTFGLRLSSHYCLRIRYYLLQVGNEAFSPSRTQSTP